MNCRRRNLFATALATVLTMGALCADAGEAIVVPSEKGKSGPSQAASKAAARDLFKFRDTAPSGSPFDVLTVPVMPERKFDPREEKRRKLERLERENWMVVGPGELQAEEEEKNFLNVRDYTLDDLDKEDHGSNLMFRDLKKDGTRHPGQFRSSTDAARQAQQQRVVTLSDDEADARRPERDPRLGGHMSSELNLQKMFEPRQTGDSLSPRFHKSDLTLQELLNSGGNTELTRGQQARREEFRNFLNKPAGANPLTGPTDPINSRSDFTRQPFNPTMPQSPSFGAGSFGSASTFARPSSTFGGLPSAGANAGNGSLFNSQPDSRSAPKPASNFDPPRRRF